MIRNSRHHIINNFEPATSSTMNKFQDILKGGDLRSIGSANEIVSMVHDQKTFDELFECLCHEDRIVVMRTADAIEKITLRKPEFLQKHKTELFNLCLIANNIELKWHLALLISLPVLNKEELDRAWYILSRWARDKKESKIVRVNSVQALYNLMQQNPGLSDDYHKLISEIGKEKIASLDARIRKLQKTR